MNGSRFNTLQCMAATWLQRSYDNPTSATADAFAAGTCLSEALDEVANLRAALEAIIARQPRPPQSSVEDAREGGNHGDIATAYADAESWEATKIALVALGREVPDQ